MSSLRFTLIADGSSDKALLQIIKWTLDCLYPDIPNKGEFADFRRLSEPPKSGDVASQVKMALQYYPCDILIYHRDAEKKDKDIVQRRKDEILGKVAIENSTELVCVVPVVMMETWLLLDEHAIKKAAGNRNYKGKIELPSVNKLEDIVDPKKLLHDTLKQVSGLKGRNLNKFNVHQAVHLVAENTIDFSILRKLNAFKIFEEELKDAVSKKLKINNGA